MSRTHARATGHRCAHSLLLAAACAASPAWGVDRSWNSDSGNWSEAGSWFPVGVPLPTDHALIGNVTGVHNDTVWLNMNDTIAALTISDGMTLRTDHSALTVTGNTLVSGSNTVPIFGGGSVVFRSRLLLELYKGFAFRTDDLSLASGATMQLTHSAFAQVNGVMNIGAGTLLDGSGLIDFTAAGVTFINSGEVRPDDNLGLTLRQLGGGSLDLDGANGDGELDLDVHPFARMTVHANSLTDAFSGTLRMGPGSTFDMRIAAGWTADLASEFIATGDGTAQPADIEGLAFSFAGLATVSGDTAHFRFLSDDVTILPQARFSVLDSSRLDLGSSMGQIMIEGGEFDMDQGSYLIFHGDTTVHAGVFTTPSPQLVDGFVHLTGDTTYDGVVTFHGFAAQGGDATVAGPTTIHADTFDMDSVGLAEWEINSGLVINADRIDQAGNHIDTLIDIRNTLSARLTINLSDPADAWVSDGLLRVAGQPFLYVTRIAGSPLHVAGEFELTSGRAVVSAPIVFGPSSSLAFGAADAVLRLNASSRVQAGAAFSGAGTLQVGAAGDLTLDAGANTAGVRLENLGSLRIDDGPGIVGVDRFQNSGAWHVQLGGHVAGSEYDRLVVSGGAADVAGSLTIEHLDLDGDAERFRPAAGSTFTILTAVGGVGSGLPANLQSSADGWTFHWSVVVNPNDIQLRLDALTPPPCAADFNHDGVVNSQDFFDFLTAFFANSADADVNADTAVNSQDFFDFLVLFFNGCG